MTRTAPGLPTATVVICVYTDNRFGDIVAAVDSVRAQDVVPAQVLVVVDHNPALLARVREALPASVRVLPNARRRGLSGARNTGVATASGDVVVFLDDDAAARPGWLRALLTPYADPEVVAVGGSAHPYFPVSRPALLPSAGTGPDATGELDWVVGCTYTGQPTGRADAHDMFLVGKTATVEGVFFDVDGETQFAVTLDEDPGTDMARAHGRYLYFRPDELEFVAYAGE